MREDLYPAGPCGWPIVSDVPEIQAFYEGMRAAGERHNTAEMCALRRGPRLDTDTSFLAAFDTHRCPFAENDIGQQQRETYRREARKAGVNPEGKAYISQLEEYPGDPAAWVGSKADIARVCRERGWGCRGAVNVAAPQHEVAHQPYRVAPDIIDRRAAEIVETAGIPLPEARKAAEKQLSPAEGLFS